MGTCAGQQDDPDARIFTGVTKGIVKFKNCFGAKGIALMRAIDRNFGDAVPFMVGNIFVGFDELPIGLNSMKSGLRAMG